MKKILLVDDSRAVSKLLANSLTDKGFEVVSCHSVDEAIEAYKQHDGSIKLVITDLIMPEKDGNDLIDYLHANAAGGMRPKIIVISGGSKGTVTGETAVMSVQGRVEKVLVKPFKPDDLLGAVRELLA